MTREDYFEWLMNLVRGEDYSKLLTFLYHTEFTYIIANDGNRAADGVYLRYRFESEEGCKLPDYILKEPCSVLEMIIALALRCEESIMSDDEIGDRFELWFWGMIKNLGLYSFDDSSFNKTRVHKIIQRFLNREYEPNGKGGLFHIKNCAYDLRNVEIWYQLCWYLDNEFY